MTFCMLQCTFSEVNVGLSYTEMNLVTERLVPNKDNRIIIINKQT